MPQVNENSEDEDDIKIKYTEASDDFFSDGETRGSLQSIAKSSSGYQLGSSTDMSETVQPDKSMLVYGTAAASRPHDLKQVDLTVLGSTDYMDSKWPNLE